jgi:hypothetical protein
MLVWELVVEQRTAWAIAIAVHTGAASLIGAAVIRAQFLQVWRGLAFARAPAVPGVHLGGPLFHENV